MPVWKRFKKGIGKQAEATLETLWSRTEWLTEEHIQGMWDMHRVRREQVIEWYAQRRRESRRQKKQGQEKSGDGDLALRYFDDDGQDEQDDHHGIEAEQEILGASNDSIDGVYDSVEDHHHEVADEVEADGDVGDAGDMGDSTMGDVDFDD